MKTPLQRNHLTIPVIEYYDNMAICEERLVLYDAFSHKWSCRDTQHTKEQCTRDKLYTVVLLFHSDPKIDEFC